MDGEGYEVVSDNEGPKITKKLNKHKHNSEAPPSHASSTESMHGGK